jgi:hypothetical protein
MMNGAAILTGAMTLAQWTATGNVAASNGCCRASPWGDGEPHHAWFRSHQELVAWSGRAGEWILAADVIWTRHDRYRDSDVAEPIARIAWKTACLGSARGISRATQCPAGLEPATPGLRSSVITKPFIQVSYGRSRQRVWRPFTSKHFAT